MKTNRFITWLIAMSALAAITTAGSSAQAWANTKRNPDRNVKISVEYKLMKAGLLTGNNIVVGVSNGNITLTGKVPTLYDASMARKIARDVDDNYAVVNDLSVLAPSVPASQISSEVMHRIQTHVFYTVYDWVTVHAHNGVVTLNGWVNAPWYVRQYQHQAEKVIGVKKVVNRLRIAIGSDWLRYRAVRLIYSDPFYQAYSLEMNPPIHIIVNGASLILEGKVQTSAERGYLSDLMRFRTDAPNVVDNIQVAAN